MAKLKAPSPAVRRLAEELVPVSAMVMSGTGCPARSRSTPANRKLRGSGALIVVLPVMVGRAISVAPRPLPVGGVTRIFSLGLAVWSKSQRWALPLASVVAPLFLTTALKGMPRMVAVALMLPAFSTVALLTGWPAVSVTWTVTSRAGRIMSWSRSPLMVSLVALVAVQPHGVLAGDGEPENSEKSTV